MTQPNCRFCSPETAAAFPAHVTTRGAADLVGPITTGRLSQAFLLPTAVFLLWLLMASQSPGAAETVGRTEYAVTVSRSTYDQDDWKPVVEALVRKYGAKVIVYDKAVAEVLEELRRQFPKHSCFVARPTEANRQFVAEVHQLTRRLDDDSYTDTRWGILTGYDAANALRIARYDAPLVVRKTAAGTEIALECCEQGLWYDELVKGKMVRRQPGGEVEQLRGPDDTTSALVDTLNKYQADLFVTSGHATERDWQIGFRYRNGRFQCAKGRLYGLDTQGARHPIDSPNAKVYMPVGNCLMGHIDGLEAMALAWLNSAGVTQMLGYTVSTWYGYGGWGCLDYFVEQPGRYTFSEAFFANQHALVHRLGEPGTSAEDRRGLEFDRDVVAFYGDPAWQARMAPGKLAYEQVLTVENQVYTFEIRPNLGEKSFAAVNTNGSQRGGRPFVHFLDRRIKNVQIIDGKDLKPVITDDFILVPRPPRCDPNRPYRVVFHADRME
ncbi:MAG TPA: hypothetical protein PKY77_03725 [Phycisphaerae bacterium]|nr:hypothetical protein [Phycisphaerae bacterium]HRY70837.1 hypothetical protein [Phycisphaerae bacterium]HSA28544.1 hypothetical protein [Phycisphaerae bacterium]